MHILFTEMSLTGLRELLQLLDQELERSCCTKTTHDSGAWSNSKAQAENIVGTGFVILQTYMATSYGVLKVNKTTALGLGPIVSHTVTVAQTVNNCANLWKHGNEEFWKLNCRARKKVQDLIAKAGVIAGPHPLLDALTLVCQGEKPTLAGAANAIDAWRWALYQSNEANKSSRATA